MWFCFVPVVVVGRLSLGVALGPAESGRGWAEACGSRLGPLCPLPAMAWRSIRRSLGHCGRSKGMGRPSPSQPCRGKEWRQQYIGSSRDSLHLEDGSPTDGDWAAGGCICAVSVPPPQAAAADLQLKRRQRLQLVPGDSALTQAEDSAVPLLRASVTAHSVAKSTPEARLLFRSPPPSKWATHSTPPPNNSLPPIVYPPGLVLRLPN